LGLFVFLGIVGAIIIGSSDTSSQPERAEKHKGVEPLVQEQTEKTTKERGRYDAVATVTEVVDGDTVQI